MTSFIFVIAVVSSVVIPKTTDHVYVFDSLAYYINSNISKSIISRMQGRKTAFRKMRLSFTFSLPVIT